MMVKDQSCPIVIMPAMLAKKKEKIEEKIKEKMSKEIKWN